MNLLVALVTMATKSTQCALTLPVCSNKKFCFVPIIYIISELFTHPANRGSRGDRGSDDIAMALDPMGQHTSGSLHGSDTLWLCSLLLV